MAAPTVVSVYPAPDATGFVLSDYVYVIFDQEVDRDSVQILIEGPDTDTWSGPDLVRWDDPTTTSDDDVLASPGFKGFVPGVYSYQKLDVSDNVVSGIFDYSGTGTLWRTKVIFTPDEPLAANTTYNIYIIGDESSADDVESGVSSRTIFDPVKGANIGDGNVIFSGEFTGGADNTYNVRVMETGDAEDGLVAQWWLSSAPGTVREITTSKRSQTLSNGVKVRFDEDFVLGDTFTVVVQPSERMVSTLTWSFTTGAGSFAAPSISTPITPSSPITSYVGSSGTSSGAALSILSITPAHRATNLDPDEVEEVVIQFSAALDDTTITDDTVTIWSESVNGDPDITADGELVKILTVSGDTLTISIG